jgi:hypothetical protein
MDPNIMSTMMQFLQKPGIMDQMKNMVETPQMQEVLNNKDLMDNVMDIFGSKQNPVDEPQKKNSSDQLKFNFNNDDKIILEGLKSEDYNGQFIKLISFNEDKQRYVVELENGKQLLVKEENLTILEEVIEDIEKESDENEENIIEIN